MRTLALFLALSSAAAAQVTGRVRYQDREYDLNGFTGWRPYRPVRQAEVEIVRAGSNQVLGTGVTDETGAFSISGIPGGTGVFARVYARRSGGGIHAVVRDNFEDKAIYTAVTGNITTNAKGEGTFPDLDLTILSGAAPPFNIFDTAVKSFQYLASLDPNHPDVPDLLTIYWEPGTSDGTYYSPDDKAVFLLGISSDPDEYDDDIILHEIGHWVAHHFSKDDSPGGYHTILDQLDARMSWSEGFAHYWSAAVRRFFPSEYSYPSWIVDNNSGGASRFDLEGPSFPDRAVMATNELAVAASLWDITDSSNEGGFDLLSGNEAEVWRAIHVRIPPRTEITLEDFREGLALEQASLLPEVTGDESSLRIMNARSILYFATLDEPNDAPAAAVPLTSSGLSKRTIYPIGDEDWYAIDLEEGLLRAETLNLGDGADTFLELFAPDGTTQLAANNDRAAGDRRSLIQFPISSPGTYYLRVTAAGTVVENGYYDIRAGIAGPLPSPPDPPRAGYCSAAAGTAGPRPGWIGILSLMLLGALPRRRRPYRG